MNILRLVAGTQSVTLNETGCGFSLEEMKYLFIFPFSSLWSSQRAALSSATQHAMLSKFGKWGTGCLNPRFPL